MLNAEDPYASMEKDRLISIIHFLFKREDERAQENQELKDMVKDLRDTHKQDMKTPTNLMKSIDRLTNQVLILPLRIRPFSRKSTTCCPRYQLATKSALAQVRQIHYAGKNRL